MHDQQTQADWGEVTDPQLMSFVEERGARILVAEDDEEMRAIVASRLTAEGYEVHEARSGVDLLGRLHTIAHEGWPLDHVDLIVLDHHMPGVTGLEVMRRLREAHWSTPAVLITAFPDDALRRRAELLGVAVLAKPFSLEKLTGAVQHALTATAEDDEPVDEP